MHYGVELREFTYEADGTGEKEHGADLTAPAVSAMPHACAHALRLSLTNDDFLERQIGPSLSHERASHSASFKLLTF